MMIDPAVEAAHTDDEIAELEERLEWLHRYRALCVGGPVSLEVWEARVQGLGHGSQKPGCALDKTTARRPGK